MIINDYNKFKRLYEIITILINIVKKKVRIEYS